jgi:hypothetical protein
MCSAYGLSAERAEDVYGRFNVLNTLPSYKPSWSVRPWSNHPVIIAHSPNKISLMYWSLIPRGAKERNQFRAYATFMRVQAGRLRVADAMQPDRGASASGNSPAAWSQTGWCHEPAVLPRSERRSRPSLAVCTDLLLIF